MKCPICSRKNTMTPCSYILQAHPIAGISIPVEIEAYECSNCEEQIETPELIKSNSIKIANSKKEWLSKQPGDINFPALIRELRKSLGLTQQEFSNLTGATGTAISKYELDTVKPSALAEKLFLLMARSPASVDEMRVMAAAAPSAPPRHRAMSISAVAWTDVQCHTNLDRPTSAPTVAVIYNVKNSEIENMYSPYKSIHIHSDKPTETAYGDGYMTSTKSGPLFITSQAFH